MYFVLKQHQELGRTFDNNVRMGGYLREENAMRAAVRNAPAIVRDDSRNIVAQTVSADLPKYIH